MHNHWLLLNMFTYVSLKYRITFRWAEYYRINIIYERINITLNLIQLDSL